MYSTDPVRDAARYFDAKDAADANSLAAYLHYSQEIRDILTKQIRHTTKLCLPYAKAEGFGIAYQPIEDVVTDQVSFGKPLAALMTVLEKSDCPHVAALREAIAANYIRMNADRIAEAAS